MMKLSTGTYAYTGGKPLDSALPGVIFIHGAVNDHSVWGLQSRSLAHHGYTVLAVDLPGHGRSTGPALSSIEAAGQWIVDLIHAAGMRRTALVGHSMGSLIALEAASWLGHQATHLVMIGTAFPMKVAPALLDGSLDDPLKAIDSVNAWSHSTLAAKPSAPSPGFWLRGGNRALMRRMQSNYTAAGHGNLFHHDFKLCDSYAGAIEAATRVRCQTRMVLGQRDPMTPPSASTSLAKALNAQVVTLPVGHSLMGEDPDAVLDAIQSFLVHH